MRRLPFTAALAAAFLTAGTLAAQTTDTDTLDRLGDDERAEYMERVEDGDDYRPGEPNPEIDVDEPIAPGEYELREVEDGDFDDMDDVDADTTGMEPRGLGDRTEWLMDPATEPESALEPEEGNVPKR